MKNIFVMKINVIHYRRVMFKSLVLHEPQNTITTLVKKKKSYFKPVFQIRNILFQLNHSRLKLKISLSY